MNGRKLKIGVLGPHACSAEEYEMGREVGRHIAGAGALLVCGGLDGMMQAAAEGAKEAGGETLGILPGSEAAAANPAIDIALPTGLGPFRNALVVRACDAVIAVRGAYGTLSEIAFALRLGIPTVGLRTWKLLRDEQIDHGIHPAENAAHAVELALELIKHG
ncbi:MAG: TIGR00725 family protein [Spartobacteria bacterium]|nr:TIGR00725 family protein [Spartobacteria bacterium]